VSDSSGNEDLDRSGWPRDLFTGADGCLYGHDPETGAVVQLTTWAPAGPPPEPPVKERPLRYCPTCLIDITNSVAHWGCHRGRIDNDP